MRQGAQENVHEEGELLAWESDLDSEDERLSSRRSIAVALVENNRISHNGGELRQRPKIDTIEICAEFGIAPCFD